MSVKWKSNSRLEKINPFRVMDVVQRAGELEAQGRRIVHMEVGEPDFSTAAPIIDAGIAALQAGLTQYTPAAGLMQLREAIAAHYRRNYNLTINAKRIFITPGASGGLLLLAHLLINADDGILLADPAYPCVRNLIHLLKAQPQLLTVDFSNNFQPSLAQLQHSYQSNTRGIWLASPSNPTGTILRRAELEQISVWARSEGLHLLVDEIYHGLHYVDEMPSALQVDSQCFVVNSFSKYYGMTGWRLGWVVVPQDCVEQVNILAQNLYISAPSMAQYAALAAFEENTTVILEQRRESFRLRGEYLCAALKSLGFKVSDNIQGAFYLYADISRFSDNSETFCRQLLEEHGVALTPGTDFGEREGLKFVRFAFTTDMESLELGVQRLAQALQ